MKATYIKLGSVTYAVKAKRLLLSHGVSARLVKSIPNSDNEGCSYGVEIPNRSLFAAADVLRREGVSYTVYEK